MWEISATPPPPPHPVLVILLLILFLHLLAVMTQRAGPTVVKMTNSSVIFQ